MKSPRRHFQNFKIISALDLIKEISKANEIQQTNNCE